MASALLPQPGIREAIESRLEDWIDYLSIEEGSPKNTYITYAKEVKRFIAWLETAGEIPYSPAMGVRGGKDPGWGLALTGSEGS